MSPEKEPFYFSCIEPKYLVKNPIRDRKKYLKLFKNVTDEVAIGEASTGYLWDECSPRLIYESIPDAKIIVSLRDPIDRAFSHYTMRISGGEKLSFLEVVEKALKAPKEDYYNHIIVNGGFYSEEIKRYFDTFGRKSVKVVIFEDFVKEPIRFVKDILKFLNVNAEPPENIKVLHNVFTKPRGSIITSILKNRQIRDIGTEILPYSLQGVILKKIMSKKSEKPKISNKERDFIKQIYQNDVKKLEEVLGYPLPWSMKK